MAPLYFEPFPHHLWPFYAVWYIFDWGVILYVIFGLVTKAQFIMAYTIGSGLSYIAHLKAVYKPVIEECDQLKRKQSTSRPLSSLTTSGYAYLLTEHFQLTREYLNLADLFSPVAFFLILTLLPINVYAVAQLVLDSTQFTPFKAIYLLVIVIEVLVMLGSTMPAHVTSLMHAPAKFIPTLQWAALKGTRLKLKYDNLMLFLTSGPKIALKVGPLQQLTKSNLYEVCENKKYIFKRIF